MHGEGPMLFKGRRVNVGFFSKMFLKEGDITLENLFLSPILAMLKAGA